MFAFLHSIGLQLERARTTMKATDNPTAPFGGPTEYLEAAALEIGRPELAGLARGVGPLVAIANLCAQASQTETRDAPGILAHAERFLLQLHVAHQAAEMMIRAVRALVERRGQAGRVGDAASDCGRGAQPEVRLDRVVGRKSRS
jgi:hypothetical protein